MKKIGFVVTSHWSEKIRPNGNDLLHKFYITLKESINYDVKIYVVDNQSEFQLTIPEDVYYIRIDDQYEKGLTGAWNAGIYAAYSDGCDIIVNCNDDLWFNESINKFIEHIIIDDNTQVIYSALTNGVLGGPQLSAGPRSGIQKINCDSAASLINGFFFGFTRKHFELYRNSDTEYFPLKHAHDGGDGKWGGQEGYWIVLHESGVHGIIVLDTFIPHTKYRAWKISKSIGNEMQK